MRGHWGQHSGHDRSVCMCAGMFAHSSACMRAGHCTKAAKMTNGLFHSQKHCCKRR